MCLQDYDNGSEHHFQFKMEYWRELSRKYKDGKQVSFFDSYGNIQSGVILSSGSWYNRIILREDGVKSLVHVETLEIYKYFKKLQKTNYVRRN